MASPASPTPREWETSSGTCEGGSLALRSRFEDALTPAQVAAMQRTANIQAFAFPRGLDPNDPATAAAMDAYVSGNNLHTLAYAGTFGHDAQEAEYWRQHSGELATWGQQFSLGTPDPAHAKEQYD